MIGNVNKLLPSLFYFYSTDSKAKGILVVLTQMIKIELR